MKKVRIKRFLYSSLCVLFLFCFSCRPVQPSYELTKDFLGYGVSIEKPSKSYTKASDRYTYVFDVWSLPPSYTKKINKQFLKISQNCPDFKDSELSFIRWTSLPMEDVNMKYFRSSLLEDNEGIQVVQEIEILMKAVLREKGNYYSYAVSNAQDPMNAQVLCFAVYCSERKLLIVLKRTKE